MSNLFQKASIITTPTAYEDGVLNSVKPAKTFGSELVTNGTFDTDLSGWTNSNNHWQWTSQGAYFPLISTHNPLTQWLTNPVGVKLKITFTLNIIQGTAQIYYDNINNSSVSTQYTESGTYTLITQPVKQNTDINFSRYGGINTEFYLNNVSVKEITEADFDFTRGSSATRVNEKGLVQDVQLLSGELVQNGDFEQIGGELVTNGSFDTDSDWSLPSGSSISGGSLNFDGTQTSGININQTLASLDLTKIYKVTFTISNYTAGQVKVKISNNAQGTNKTANGTYTEYLSGMVNNTLTIRGDGAFIGSIDNVSVKEVGQNWTFGTGWSIEDGKPYRGAEASGSNLQQNSILTIGKKYKVTLDVLENTGTNKVFIGSGTAFTLSGTGTQTFTGNCSSNTTLYVQASNHNSEVKVDNISVIEITDDTDLPRINYTDGEGSLLLENQSTNLVTYSEDFSQSSWVKLGAGTGSVAVVTNNFAISPDGTQNASRLQCNLNGGTTTSDQSLIYDLDATNSTQTISVYMKSNNGQNQTIYFTNTFTGDSSDEALVTTQWQRFTFSHSTSNHTFSLGLRGNTGSDDTADILIWGAQAEALSYATSYIPTNGSTVTRLADVCNNSGNSDLINSTEGVLYAEISALANGGTHRILSLSDETNNNLMFIRFDVTPNRIVCFGRGSGGSYNVLTTSGVDQTNNNKIALVWDNTNVRVWINGSQTITQTINNLPINMSTLSFTNPTGSETFYGNVKCVAVFKEALSDTELQCLTS